MKISQMMERLEHIKRIHGDIEVMFVEPEGDGIYGVNHAEFELVSDDNAHPREWGMPKGFKYVSIEN